MRLKTTLKDIYDIKDYIQYTLENDFGFDVTEDSSSLSDSQYLTIWNWGEKTKEFSKHNDEKIIIRISNHDLPPSYDGKYGYYDFDLKSKYDDRNGLQGDAIPYYDFIYYVESLIDRKKINVNLPIWMNKKDLTLMMNKIDNIDDRLFLLEFINGASWSKYKKPTTDMIKKHFQDNIDNEFFNDKIDELTKFYFEIV